MFSPAAVGVVIAEFDDPGLGDLAAGELTCETPLAHDENTIGERGQFLDVGGDHDNADAGAREGADGIVDLLAGADVDAARGLVEDQEPDARPQPAGDQRLLLVAAGKARDLGVDCSGS